MPLARRSAYLFFYCHDGLAPDLPAILRGEAKLLPMSQLYAISLLTGEEHPISGAELEALLSVPSNQWVEPPRNADVPALAAKGLLLTQDANGPLADLRAREERLAATQWNLYGAVYHLMTRWDDVDLRPPANGEDEGLGELPVADEAMIAAFVERFGLPPTAFQTLLPSERAYDLPLERGEGQLYDALARRRTTRGFDRSRPLPLAELGLVLYEVFGCQGTAPIFGEFLGLRKTSPSGGGLHPTEVYPLVTAVEGLEPGLYHYDVGRHALEPLEALAAEEAVDLATTFSCGQTYFASAHVTFVLTSRFERSFWKYRRNQRGLAALLMDAGHLSQTLYLIAADRGLGAYVTVAINAAAIDERLGLDGVREGSIALAGCGLRWPERSPLEPEFRPYVPRRTQL